MVPPLALAAGAVCAALPLSWSGLRLPTRGILAAALFGMWTFGVPALAHEARVRSEAPVIQNMYLIAMKQDMFRVHALRDQDADGRGEYGPLFDLSRTRPPLVHEALGAGDEFGYRFSVILPPKVDDGELTYFAYAVPDRYGVTGRRALYVDETGVVRIGDLGPQPVLTRELGMGLPPVDLGTAGGTR